MPDTSGSSKFYRRSVRTSFFLVLLLVFVGGVVRSTGAGLGCPDWPKCFGLWIPPTKLSQIPAEFWNHPLSSDDGKIIFNPVKTWIEYLNRLLGVIIGFAILVQAIASFLFSRIQQARFWSGLSLVLVLFQGWLGSRVVSSDLKPLIISLHLFVALLIAIALLIALFYACGARSGIGIYPVRTSGFKPLVTVASLVLLLQFYLGTEVRAQVDHLFREYFYESRHLYADRLDYRFWIHRSFSIAAFMLLVFQWWKGFKWIQINRQWIPLLPLLLSIFLILSGVVLSRFDFPAILQPFHLLLGLSLICSQAWLCLHVFFGKNSEPNAG